VQEAVREEDNYEDDIPEIDDDSKIINDAINDFSDPLVTPVRKKDAKLYGYSFNSKQVAQGPAFFNLRIMCHCLGHAIKRHLDFSRNTFWFLDELNEAKENEKAFGLDEKDVEDLAMFDFSYKFHSDLKIPTNEDKEQSRHEYKNTELRKDLEEQRKKLDKEKINPFKHMPGNDNIPRFLDYGSDDDDIGIRQEDIDDVDIDIDNKES
jgi:hypothetical protein